MKGFLSDGLSLLEARVSTVIVCLWLMVITYLGLCIASLWIDVSRVPFEGLQYMIIAFGGLIITANITNIVKMGGKLNE